MQRYYNKEEREVIEQINFLLSMQHRSKPYDMNNIEDLKGKLTEIIAQFIDYQRYSFTISNVLEQFDESLEYFDPISWTRIFSDVENYDKQAVKTYYSIRHADDNLLDLAERAEDMCKEFLLLVAKLGKEIKIAVLGKAYLYNDDDICRIFEESYEIMDTYSFEESRDAFLQVMDRCLLVEE